MDPRFFDLKAVGLDSEEAKSVLGEKLQKTWIDAMNDAKVGHKIPKVQIYEAKGKDVDLEDVLPDADVITTNNF